MGKKRCSHAYVYIEQQNQYEYNEPHDLHAAARRHTLAEHQYYTADFYLRNQNDKSSCPASAAAMSLQFVSDHIQTLLLPGKLLKF